MLVAIGRSGNHRRLGCPGEDLDKVYNRLYDPKDFSGKNALVVGGGDSALECAIALAGSGAKVTVSYRKPEFARPKPENVEKLKMLEHDPKADVQVERPSSERVTTAFTSEMMKNAPPGSVTLATATTVTRIDPDKVTPHKTDGSETVLPNDVVFSMIGREAPLDFFRRSGLHVRGDWRPITWISCLAFVLFCVVLYHWKSNHPQEFPVQRWANQAHAFPFNVPKAIDAAGGKIAEWSNRETNLLHRQTWPRNPPPSITRLPLRLRADLRDPAYPAAAHALCEMADGRAHLLAVDSALHSARTHPPLDGSQRFFRDRSSVALAR